MAWCNKPNPNLNLPCQAIIDLISGFIETFSFPGGKDKRHWCKEQAKRTVRFSFSFLHFKASISFELFIRARDGEPSRRVLIGLI